jgi:hypothetical protein
MEMRLNRETVSVTETVFDGMQEQSVELDYVLPDYYPEIFKLVKCSLTPRIVSQTESEGRINYELAVHLKIMYCAEDGNLLQCVNQKLTYSKSIELGRAFENVTAVLHPKCDYVNCRVVNQRRLDVRGAVTVKARVFAEQKRDILSDVFPASGVNVQLKKQTIPYAAGKLTASKQFVVEEELELGASNPCVINIVRSNAVIAQTEKKIIANKLISKGDVNISVLYSCEKDNTGALEAMQFSVPYSHIIDMDGITENYFCTVNLEVVGCEVKSSGGENGARTLQCEVTVSVNVQALKPGTTEVITDAYSTTHECNFVTAQTRIEQIPRLIDIEHKTSSELENSESEIDCVYDVWAEVSNVNASAENGVLTVTGMLKYSCMARSESGMPVMLEKDEAFECVHEIDSITENSAISPRVTVTNAGYTLVSARNVAVRADLRINGELFSAASIDILTDLSVDENARKQNDGDYALKLYFAGDNEDIWDIAKKYCSSPEAIMEENELEAGSAINRGMYIIPILN